MEIDKILNKLSHLTCINFIKTYENNGLQFNEHLHMVLNSIINYVSTPDLTITIVLP